MGVALFIVLERPISGLDSYVNGKALSWAEESLDGLANQLGVTPLMAFFSVDPAEGAEFLDELGAQEAVVDADAIISDLREFQCVLQRAADEGVRWHLAVDS